MTGSTMTDWPDAWNRFLGQEIVVDLASPYVILGTLQSAERQGVVLIDADVHDLRDSKSTRELYVLEARRHGIRTNRRQVWVATREIVSLSPLADVLE
jgi:hypothetical protein